jgi:hypothetical protein
MFYFFTKTSGHPGDKSTTSFQALKPLQNRALEPILKLLHDIRDPNF